MGPVQPGGQAAVRPLREGEHLLLAPLNLTDRGGEDRPGPQAGQPGRLAVQPAGHATAGPAAQLGDERELLGHVWNNPPGRVGGGGRADVGDVVEERSILLVPDGADHGGLAGGHGPDERLVGERQQVLDLPATAGDDYDLYRRVRVEALQGVKLASDGTYNPLNSPNAKAYPIASPTWMLVYQSQTDPAKGAALKAFLTFILTDGQKFASSVDYAPLPPAFVKATQARVNAIKA